MTQNQTTTSEQESDFRSSAPTVRESKSVAYSEPDSSLLKRFTAELLSRANAIEVIDDEGYDQAAALLKRLTAEEKRLEEERKTLTAPLTEALEAARVIYRDPLKDLGASDAGARGIIKKKMGKYLNEKERQARLARAAEEERARKERDAIEARADKHEAAGRVERATELRDTADLSQAPTNPVAPPKAAGVSVGRKPTVHVVDEDAFYKGLGDRSTPRKAVKLDQKWLNQQAKALGEDFNVPGCRVTWENDVRG